jgi:tape measure domain-containing protein
MVNEKLIVELSADIKGLKSQLNTAQSDLQSFASANKQTSDKIQNSFNGASDGIKNLVIGYFSLNAAIQAVGASFDRALKLDAINSALTAVLGSSEAAAAQFQQLSQFADQYGLNLVAVGEAYKNFAAAAVSANVPLEQTNYIFESVAKAASVLKLSNDDLKGSLNALSQMISKGTVSAEELRGQLGERLPGAFNLAAKAMGVTTSELGKMLENGEIMAGDLLPKLALELNKTFGDKIVGSVDSLQASVNRLDNSFTNAVNGGKIGEFFKAIIDGANSTLEVIESDSWGEFFTRFGLAITGNTALAKSYDTIYDSLKNLNKETKKTDVDVLKSFGTPAAPKAPPKTKRPRGGESTLMTTMNDLTDAKAGLAAENLAAFNAEVEMLSANITQLAGSYNGLYTDPAMEAYIANMQTIVGLLADTLTSSFNNALDSGQNFFKSLGQALLALIKKLVIAAAVAALLSFFLGGIGVASSISGFAPIFKQLSGLDFSQGSATGSMVAMPNNTTGQGGYQIDIMGDKMRLLLDNQAIKNSRVI